VLDLVPEHEEQHDRECHEDERRGGEAKPCASSLAAPFDPRAPAGTVKSVGAVDSSRVDGRLLGRRRDTAGWLGHPRDCKDPVCHRPAARAILPNGSGDDRASGSKAAGVPRGVRARG
jgi:hypothetical protein